MTARAQLSDMDLAALISSKICHDVIGPVGALGNGLQMLDDERDPDSQAYALDMIRNVSVQASARIQFARFAYGAAGAPDTPIDLMTAKEISVAYVGIGKHKLVWDSPPGQMAKDKAKLFLNLIAGAITALPRGGEIKASVHGTLETPSFELRCTGKGARPPQYLADFVGRGPNPALDALTVQAYYTVRLAQSSGMKIAIASKGEEVVITAR